MQRPLVEGIHPQHGDIARGRAVVRQRLDKIAVLIKIARGVAAHANVDGALQGRRVVRMVISGSVVDHRDRSAQQRTAVCGRGESIVLTAAAAALDGNAGDLRAAGVDENERQMRAEQIFSVVGTGCIGGALKMLMIAWVLIGQHG